ncbi:MAG: hypothetical protein AMXMBFR58_31670 [Phycisphaerae bacterium]
MNVARETFAVESVEEFVKRIAVWFVPNGYFFYVVGHVPTTKDPETVDRKLAEKYGFAISEWARYRQRQRGHAGIQYVRHGRLFVLLATHGHHLFFAEEPFKDLRRSPLRAFGYAVSHRRGHAHVRIEREEFARLRRCVQEAALHRSEDALSAMLWQLPYDPYAPVRHQYLQILRDVNRARKTAGLALVPIAAVRLRRAICRVRPTITGKDEWGQ